MRNLITTVALLALFGNPGAIAAARPATDRGPSGAVTIPRDGKCQVTLMIAEAVDPEKPSPLSAARLSFPIGQGESAARERRRSLDKTHLRRWCPDCCRQRSRNEGIRTVVARRGHAVCRQISWRFVTVNRGTRRRHTPKLQTAKR
jgi:hypothetical protein